MSLAGAFRIPLVKSFCRYDTAIGQEQVFEHRLFQQSLHTSVDDQLARIIAQLGLKSPTESIDRVFTFARFLPHVRRYDWHRLRWRNVVALSYWNPQLLDAKSPDELIRVSLKRVAAAHELKSFRLHRIEP